MGVRYPDQLAIDIIMEYFDKLCTGTATCEGVTVYVYV